MSRGRSVPRTTHASTQRTRATASCPCSRPTCARYLIWGDLPGGMQSPVGAGPGAIGPTPSETITAGPGLSGVTASGELYPTSANTAMFANRRSAARRYQPVYRWGTVVYPS